MVFSWIFYWQHVFTESENAVKEAGGLPELAAYFLMLLCTAVVVVLGLPLMADAFESIVKRKKIDANLLIVLGVIGAYCLSVYNTIIGHYYLYFDTAAGILVLVTIGQFLDAKAKKGAMEAGGNLLESLPNKVWLKSNNKEVEVDHSQIKIGDTLRVNTGEQVSADGIVVEGSSDIDERFLTGESKLRQAEISDMVFGGSVCIDGQLWIKVQSVGTEMAIGKVQQLLLDVRKQKMDLQRLVDRVAMVFVPLVLFISLAVFITNCLKQEYIAGMLQSLSVLLISCPCALGIATPLATYSSIKKAAKRGILIKQAKALEAAASITHLYIDKTGTLTQDRMTVSNITPCDSISQEQLLKIAVKIEATSKHPIGLAIIDQAKRRGEEIISAEKLKVLPGLGLSASINGKLYELGSSKLVIQYDDKNSLVIEDHVPRIYLASGGQVIGRIDLEETLRQDVPEAIKKIKSLGIKIKMLTGDSLAPAKVIAEKLNIDYQASLLPDQKLEILKQAKRSGQHVGMLGDGINDGPVIGFADVGIAMGSGTDFAKYAGQICLVGNRLEAVAELVQIARHNKKRIVLNLFWAFSYNTVGIGLAASGMLNPLIAGSAMVISSLLIVLSSSGAGTIKNETQLESSIHEFPKVKQPPVLPTITGGV